VATSNVITDAELVNKFAQQALKEPEVSVETKAPLGPEVKLPGGFIENGALVTTAEVRELTGLDEEAIARATSVGKALGLILQRGLVKLGDRDVAPEDLDLLLSGDRDALLIGIRRVTFGDTIDFSVTCGNCGEAQQTSIDLEEDVPVTTLNDSIADRNWTVITKKNSIGVALPTGITQRKLWDNMDKTNAEINTMLLSGCVLSINGAPSMGASSVLKLGMAERSEIVSQIIEKNPGPRLGEVTKTCEACGEKISLPLSLVDLFRL
jgi:hypothetical protein